MLIRNLLLLFLVSGLNALPVATSLAEDLEDRVLQACGDDICCQKWYGEGLHGYDDLGMEECRGYAPSYRNLDFWCSAKNYEPPFCSSQSAPSWTPEGGQGKCFPPNVAEEMPSDHGVGQTKNWIVWDPVVGAFGWGYYGSNQPQDEFAKQAYDDCRARGGEKCYYSGGCIGEPTGVAVPQDRSWAFVACADDIELAKESAKERCENATGCSCEVEDAGQLDFNSWFLPIR